MKPKSPMSATSRHERISQLLACEGLYTGEINITVLEGGLWNEAVRVEAGSRTFVFKSFCAVDTLAFFPNSALDEAKALKRLSGLAISPAFVAIWPEENLLAYEYVSGNTWRGDVEAVAQLLKRKEAADPTGFALGKLTPLELLAEGDALFARCRLATPPSRPVPIVIPPPSRLSLIHRDMGPNNLIGEGEALRLIDWQCPTLGDLTEDIYSFLAPAFHIVSERTPLTPQDIKRFFQALDLPAAKARYILLAPYFAWRMAAYSAWRSEMHSDPVIRARYRCALAAESAFIDTHLP